jgi:hypothetical protein
MTQLGLFAAPQAGPAGLRYTDDFIGEPVERELIGRIAALPLQRFQFGAFMMDGEARSQWEHSIPPVEARRYSITFRTMKPA